MNPVTYLKLGGLFVLLVATALIADANGADRVIARHARVLQHAQDAMAHAAKKLNAAQDRLADAEMHRHDTVREIYREVPTLVDRPVYRAVCGDDDGVRLVDKAADAANGRGSEPAPPAGGSAHDPAQH